MLLRTNFYCRCCFLGMKRGNLEPHKPEKNERNSGANVNALPNHRLLSFLVCAVRPLTFRNVFIFYFFITSLCFTTRRFVAPLDCRHPSLSSSHVLWYSLTCARWQHKLNCDLRETGPVRCLASISCKRQTVQLVYLFFYKPPRRNRLHGEKKKREKKLYLGTVCESKKHLNIISCLQFWSQNRLWSRARYLCCSWNVSTFVFLEADLEKKKPSCALTFESATTHLTVCCVSRAFMSVYACSCVCVCGFMAGWHKQCYSTSAKLQPDHQVGGQKLSG